MAIAWRTTVARCVGVRVPTVERKSASVVVVPEEAPPRVRAALRRGEGLVAMPV
jgi:hypothetical protein